MIISRAQQFMADNGIDAWLLYDYGHRNPYTPFILGDNRPMVKKYFVLIPPAGEPEAYVTYTGMLKTASIRITVVTYDDDVDLAAKLRERLAEFRTVAVEFSPGNCVPRIDVLPKGVADFLEHELRLTLVSSEDLAQYATAYSHEQIRMLRRANSLVGRIHREAYDFIGAKTRAAQVVNEYEVQQFIVRRQEEAGLVNPVHVFPPFVGEEFPAVAANEHINDFYYMPSKDNHAEIRKGDVVVIDFPAKLDEDGAPYADVTSSAYVGACVPDELAARFDTIVRARDRAIQYVREAVASGNCPQGWEVDAAARDVVAEAGYARHFTHRAGHDLGMFAPWGERANIDSLSRETRRLIPGTGFALETGLYFPGQYGIRTEVDVTIDTDGTVEVDECMQTGMYTIDC